MLCQWHMSRLIIYNENESKWYSLPGTNFTSWCSTHPFNCNGINHSKWHEITLVMKVIRCQKQIPILRITSWKLMVQATVDGSEIRYGKYPIIYKVYIHPTWWSSDFWTINHLDFLESNFLRKFLPRLRPRHLYHRAACGNCSGEMLLGTAAFPNRGWFQFPNVQTLIRKQKSSEFWGSCPINYPLAKQ